MRAYLIIFSLGFLLTTLTVFPQTAAATGWHYHHPKDDSGLKILRPRSGKVALQQVQMLFEAGRIINSDWGRIRVKRWHRADDCSGYVNVFLEADARTDRDLEWAVDNMHVPRPFHCQGKCNGPVKHNEVNRGKPENNKHNFPMTRFFDLRPNEVGMGRVSHLRGVVVLSERPLPNSDEIWRAVGELPILRYPVGQALYNAEGDLGEVVPDSTPPPVFPPESLTYHLVGQPPQPTYPPFVPDLDLAAPIEVFQDTWPNVNAGNNQCVPMAHANAFRYLETQFNVLPLTWNLPHFAFRGLGIVDNAGDVLFWTAVPDNSVVAHVDQKTKRAGVFDFETGSGSNRCQNIRGAFAYIQEFLGADRAIFRHQGGADFYGFGDNNNCNDYLPEAIGNYESHREGVVPTWQWIFDQLLAGRSVVISYGYYDSNGLRTGGHMLRIYGAAKYSNKTYLYGLDDGIQGDNFVGTDLPFFEVADTENSGEDGEGKTDDMLNIDGQSWEIEFALSTQALPGLIIP